MHACMQWTGTRLTSLSRYRPAMNASTCPEQLPTHVSRVPNHTPKIAPPAIAITMAGSIKMTPRM